MVAQVPVKDKVVGPNPTRGANKIAFYVRRFFGRMEYMEINQIRKELEQYLYQASTEGRKVIVGVKDKLDLFSIVKKFPILYSQKTISFLQKVLAKEKNPLEKEKIERLISCISDIYLFRKTALIEDKISTFKSKAKIKIDKKDISFYNLEPLISNSDNYEIRDKYGKAYINTIKKTLAQSQKVFEITTSSIKKDLKYNGYIDYCQKTKQINYNDFAERLKLFASDTEKLYKKEVGFFLQSLIGKKLGEIPFWHFFYARKIPYLDKYFPKNQLLPSVYKTLSGLGINLKEYKNIHIDAEPRPKKHPRACCYFSKTPQEIYLIIKPTGGIMDYGSFYHELGHTLHHGLTNPNLDFEIRHLSRSYTLSEVYAYLLEDLCCNPVWLKEIIGLNKKEINRVIYSSTLLDFMLMRRYIGKFLYELEMFKKSLIKDGGKIYAKKLSDLTGFIYYPERYLDDTDAGFYSADYLRAWIANAQFKDYIIKRFGQNWFTKKKAGDFLKDLWFQGELFSSEELIEKLGYKAFDSKYLLKEYQTLTKMVNKDINE